MFTTQPEMIIGPDGARIDINDISLESMGIHCMFGEIEADTMKDAISFLLRADVYFKTPISLILNTTGGSARDGFALVDIMTMSKVQINTIGIGNIHSMGVLLLSAGHKGHRTISRNATIMAHQFSNTLEGKFHELESSYNSMVYLKHQFFEHFRRHSTMTDSQINDIIFGSTDKYLTPQECKKYGLVDHVVDPLPILPKAAHFPVRKSSRRAQQ